MSNYDFESIKAGILIWINKEKQSETKKRYFFEISKDNDKVLSIDFTFKYCMAQIVVNEPYFAPYKLVSFEALTLDSKKSRDSRQPELIYFYYDSEETEESEVIKELQIAVDYCADYIPDELEKKICREKRISK